MIETHASPKADADTLYQAAMFDYAAGTLPAGPAFVVAAHFARPAWLDDELGAREPSPKVGTANGVAHMLSTLDQGRWKRNLAGMLVKPVPGVAAQLLKLESGRSVPHHGHFGLELTLVLSGAFGDGHGIYRRGDLVIHDEDSEHQPSAVAGSDCICLISQTAPIRLNGPLGWLINRFAA
jgi:putative transcriptional regulator